MKIAWDTSELPEHIIPRNIRKGRNGKKEQTSQVTRAATSGDQDKPHWVQLAPGALNRIYYLCTIHTWVRQVPLLKPALPAS